MHIFLSYRREDSQHAMGRLQDHLDVYFGPENVFRDIDRIAVGAAFPDRLREALAKTDAVVVVIGPKWLDVRDHDGQRRLDAPSDYVRMEVAQALALGKVIMPVLVDGAAMPSAEALPPDLRELAFVNATSLPRDQGFRGVVAAMAREIATRLGVAWDDYYTTLSDCRGTGLVSIFSNFRDDVSVNQEMASTRSLIVVMNDGRGWLDQNRELVHRRLRRADTETRVVLLHPRSDFIATLIRKNGKSRQAQTEEIERTRAALLGFEDAVSPIEVRGHHGFNGFSLILGDRYAYVSPYLYNERGALPLLRFSANAPDGLYHQFRQDAMALFQKASPLAQADFEEAPPDAR